MFKAYGLAVIVVLTVSTVPCEGFNPFHGGMLNPLAALLNPHGGPGGLGRPMLIRGGGPPPFMFGAPPGMPPGMGAAMQSKPMPIKFKPCLNENDAHRLCEGVPSGDQLIECLTEHSNIVSKGCAAVLSCSPLVMSKCSSVEPGGGRILECLKSNSTELTKECKAEIPCLSGGGPCVRVRMGNSPFSTEHPNQNEGKAPPPPEGENPIEKMVEDLFEGPESDKKESPSEDLSELENRISTLEAEKQTTDKEILNAKQVAEDYVKNRNKFQEEFGVDEQKEKFLEDEVKEQKHKFKKIKKKFRKKEEKLEKEVQKLDAEVEMLEKARDNGGASTSALACSVVLMVASAILLM